MDLLIECTNIALTQVLMIVLVFIIQGEYIQIKLAFREAKERPLTKTAKTTVIRGFGLKKEVMRIPTVWLQFLPRSEKNLTGEEQSCPLGIHEQTNGIGLHVIKFFIFFGLNQNQY